jgi:NAD(P)-dependent dehydrogenase (short-subunit alcohol dehydrogenase family)
MRDLRGRAALDEEAARRKVSLHVLQLDITRKDDIAQAVGTIVQQSGGIYALVNNGGIGLRGYFEDLTEEEIQQVFQINVFGTMEMTRAVLPHMRAARRGRILIISSVAGLIGALSLSSYCATKFAQEGFGESLAQEVMPFGIFVSLIEPAVIKNERWGINRNIAKGALDPASPYSAWFREAERLADRIVDTSPTRAAHVVRAVHSALVARRPRLRYMVGRRAGLIVALRRYLPRDFFDQLYFGTVVRKVTKAGPLAR